jgi:hypothetical protein
LRFDLAQEGLQFSRLLGFRGDVQFDGLSQVPPELIQLLGQLRLGQIRGALSEGSQLDRLFLIRLDPIELVGQRVLGRLRGPLIRTDRIKPHQAQREQQCEPEYPA